MAVNRKSLILLVTLAISTTVSCQTDPDYDTDTEYGQDETPQGPLSPLERAGEVLRKMQRFLDSTIERAIKEMLPTVVRSGQETDTSPKCMNAVMSIVGGIRSSQVWTFQSELFMLIP